MKKAILSILLVCYVMMTTGVVAISHYCMDRLASVSLFVSRFDKKCGKCGMEKEQHACCNDQEAFIKLETDHNKTSFVVLELPPLQKLPILTTDFLLTSLFNGFYKPEYIDISPPLPDNEVYLKNNVFRI